MSEEEVIIEEDETPKNAWQEFVDSQQRAFEHMRKALEALLPDSTREHLTNAADEFKNSFASLKDAVNIDLKRGKGEEAGDSEEDKPSTTGKTKVKVEVE